MSLTNGKILKDKTVDIDKKLNEAIYTTDMSYGKSLVNVDALNEAIGDLPDPADVPGVANVGSGADLYKGLNPTTDNHEIRGLTARVVQPVTSDNQLTGTVAANAVVSGDNVELSIDFSRLKVPIPKRDGIPEYYINSAADATIADGSIVRPYKTWEACRAVIVGTGQDWNPQIKNARVTFQTGMTITETLSVLTTTFVLENDSTLTYRGNAYAVCDMKALIDAIPLAGNGAKQYYGSITFEGFGRIRKDESVSNTSPVVIRCAGYSNSSPSNLQGNYTIRFYSGRIRIADKQYDLAANFDSTTYTNGANRTVYVLKKQSGSDIIPATSGLIEVVGRNKNIRDAMYVDQGCILNITPSIQRAIYASDEAGIVNYGTILFETQDAGGGYPGVRYGQSKATPNDDWSFNKKYTPSDTVSLVTLTGGSALNTSATGSITSFVLGSTNEGGYNAFVELVGEGSQFQTTGESTMSSSSSIRFNHLFYFSGVGSNRLFSISEAYTTSNLYKSIIGSSVDIKSDNTNRVNISSGRLESRFHLSSTPSSIVYLDIFNSNTSTSNLAVSGGIMLRGEVTYSTSLIGHYEDSTAASANLIRGMLFRTGENLKIVV